MSVLSEDKVKEGCKILYFFILNFFQFFLGCLNNTVNLHLVSRGRYKLTAYHFIYLEWVRNVWKM